MSNKTIRSTVLAAIAVFLFSNQLQAANEQVRVVPASELEQWWKVVPGHDPELSIDIAQAGVEGCVAVAFEIHGDGRVSNERVWRRALTNIPESKQFEQFALQTMHQRHFIPAPTNTNHDAVYTYQVFTNTLSLLADPMPGAPPMPTASDRHRAERQGEQDEAPCKMSDFPQQVQAMINGGKTGGQP
ncbi:MAG TPA: hypothetical protein VN693_04575 [Rhodanobacteraceae bacterium]|nr:hypothetical protein [Rhodanobacteraceae bacterium]